MNQTVKNSNLSQVFLFFKEFASLKANFVTRSFIMKQTLPSPSFNFPSMDTPHHPVVLDQMINPQAQKVQGDENKNYSFGSLTPQNFITSGQTPHSLLSSQSPIFAPPSPTPAAPLSLNPPAKMDPGFVPQVQNIMSTVSLGCRLDLNQIALNARNAEYNPKRFAAVIMCIREPRTTALIFSSGKIVCTGAKSEEDSRLAARKHARIIQKLGFPVKFKDFKIQKIISSCNVKFPIRLECLGLAHSQFTSYEPELFQGLVYRMEKPKITLRIFASGKVVLIGTVRQEINEAFANIHPILKKFKRQ